MEETVYLLALTLALEVPVVVTGAMRLPGMPGFDGPANLAAATTAALDPRVAALGPVVVFADRVHAARWVSKVHSVRVDPFESRGGGVLAEIVERRVALTGVGAPADHLGMPSSLDDTVVDLVWTVAGSDGYAVDAFADRASGLVIAGFGGGHVPPRVADAVERATQAGVVVVIASRGGAGPALTDTYRGRGSEQDLRALGAVPAGSLAPVKARLRLQVALALGLDPAGVFGS
jgi:L-asparaginase